MDTAKLKSFLIEAKIENEALQNQLIELKKIVKIYQKQLEDLNLEKEKQIQELTYLNKTNERMVSHLREKMEEVRSDDEKRKVLLLQAQLKEKQNEVAKFLEIAQAKELELQKAKELVRQQRSPEGDLELKAAQKHLAKKMKEVNDLTELNEKYLQKIAEWEEDDRQKQRELKELKERAAKLQRAQEEVESKINYFKGIEAKYHKLQGLIHNLEVEPEAPKNVPMDLFAINKPAAPFKESLFE